MAKVKCPECEQGEMEYLSGPGRTYKCNKCGHIQVKHLMSNSELADLQYKGDCLMRDMAVKSFIKSIKGGY